MTGTLLPRTAIAVGLVLILVGCQTPPNPPPGPFAKYKPYSAWLPDRAPANGSVKVTFLGASTLLFDDGQTQLMTDGFFSRPPVALPNAKIQTDPAAVDSALSSTRAYRVKAIFAAHSHVDSAFDVAYVAQRTGAKLYGSESTLNIGRGGGLREDQMALYEPGKPLTVGQFTVTILKSKHSPPVPGANYNLDMAIDKPLTQPALLSDYVEGGSFDMLIQHGGHSIYVKPSANYIEGALDNTRADVLFLSTCTLSKQNQAFRDSYYGQTVAKLQPKLVVPMHWDNILMPLSERLRPVETQDLYTEFDFLIERAKADHIKVSILQGYQSVMLFE